MTTLRRYQEEDFFRPIMSDLLDGDIRKIVISSPTGTGKSTTMTAILGDLMELRDVGKGPLSSALVVVPQTQIRDSFFNSNENIILSGSKKSVTRIIDTKKIYWDPTSGEAILTHLESLNPRQFAMVVTHAGIVSVLNKLPKDLKGKALVIDEGHHSSENKKINQLSRLRDLWEERGGHVFLVTATPFRHDGNPVYNSEEYEEYSRSMAEHVADKDEEGNFYAPQNLIINQKVLGIKAKSCNEFKGESTLTLTKDIKQIVKFWISEGRPKTGIIVPSTNSTEWADKLTSSFPKGTKVCNAVGTDTETKKKFQKVLKAERKVTDWKDSEVDVILACKRFDEGTDWPLCSHVFVIGYPNNFPLAIQRWGRTMRLKSKILGHKHPDIASITFFIPGWTKELTKEYEKKKELKNQRDQALLLACFLDDYSTGKKYAAMGIGMIQELKRRVSKTKGAERAVSQAFTLNEADRAEAKRKLVVLKEQLRDQNNPSSLDLAEAIKEKESLWGEKETLDVMNIFGEELAEKNGEKARKFILDKFAPAIQKVVKKSKRKGKVSKAVIRAEMRAVWEQIISDPAFKNLAVPNPEPELLETVASFTGETIQDLSERLKNEVEHYEAEHDLEKIKAGILKFFNEIGGVPNYESKEATRFVGYKTSWAAIYGFLIRQGTTFIQLCKSLGLLEIVPTGNEWVEAILKGSERYIDHFGHRPSANSGEATPFVGFKAKWGSIDKNLREGGLGISTQYKGIPGLLDTFGIGESYFQCGETRTVDQLKKEIINHYEHFKTPPTGNTIGHGWYEWSRKKGINFSQIRDEVLISKIGGPHNMVCRTPAAFKRRMNERENSPPFCLRWWMAQKNLLAENLIEKTKLGRNTLSAIENGKRVPQKNTKLLIAKALGVSPEEILWGLK